MAPGDGQPTPSLLCWALGVPGQETEESDGAPGMGKRVEEDEVEEGVVSIASRRGCSWRIDSWVRERGGGGREGEGLVTSVGTQKHQDNNVTDIFGQWLAGCCW